MTKRPSVVKSLKKTMRYMQNSVTVNYDFIDRLIRYVYPDDMIIE